MIPRNALATIRSSLSQFPAVALLGPRQIGKSTLARAIVDERGKDNAHRLDLERPRDKAQLAEPELYLEAHRDQLVVLDEIQQAPNIFATLKSVIDDRRAAGRPSGHFLLLGSASIDLLRQSAETLAGRITYIELPGLTLDEIKQAAPDSSADVLTNTLWLRGGFPDSYLADDDAQSTAWREAFIQTYLERDIPALGPRVPAETLRRFWTMLAHKQGSVRNAAQLANALDLSGQTIARYTDLLVDLLLLRALEPWHKNVGKRIVKSPKYYVRDSGLLHTLLDITTLDGLLSHPVVGMSWEGFAIEQVLAHAQGFAPYYYRTSTGTEIDLILERGERRIAFEIKRTLSPSVSTGFRSAATDVGATERYYLYPGTERYPLDRDTDAVPLTTITELFKDR